MLLPPPNDIRWRRVVTGMHTPDFEFLAVKVLLARITAQMAKNPSPEAILASATELRTLLEKNAHLPSAKRDIAKIVGGLQ